MSAIPKIQLDLEDPEESSIDKFRREQEAQLNLDEENARLERSLEAARKKNEALEVELEQLMSEGSPQMVELKEEVYRLTNELVSVKQRNYADLQLLATTMATRNAEFSSDFQRLQLELQTLSPPPHQNSSDSDSSSEQRPEAQVRIRSPSFAKKVKSLFSGGKKTKKKDHDDLVERDKVTVDC
jgi:trehalose/maltose hydrolase-like predicted phosphorylase